MLLRLETEFVLLVAHDHPVHMVASMLVTSHVPAISINSNDRFPE